MSKYEIENVKLTAPKFNRKDLEYAMTYRVMHVRNLIVLKRFLMKIGKVS